MHKRPAVLITAAILLIIGIAHLLRLFYQTNVTVGESVIPVWISLPALVIAVGLAAWLWYDNK